MSFSSSSCSASESTSLRVEVRCWSSTTRQAVPAQATDLELPAHRVQIVDDTADPHHRLHHVGGDPAEVRVVRLEPAAALLLVAAHQRVEAAVEPHQEERQLARLGVGIEQELAAQARGGGG